MNIIITAGGTRENIDGVRSITNTGTGALSSLIAEYFAVEEKTEKIYYVCSTASVRPKPSDKIEEVPIGSVQDLLDAMTDIAAKDKIDLIVHAMAVSDYTVASVVSAADVRALAMESSDTEEFLEKLAEADLNKKYTKLPSNASSPMILLKPTPKVIAKLKELFPKAQLIGFKLLDKVPHEELIDVAFRLLEKNGCGYVLANDYQSIREGCHTGYLVDKDKNEKEFLYKDGIAKGIVETVMGDFK